MKRAWLVVNSFLQREKFKELYQWFFQAARKRDVSLELHGNANLLPMYSPDGIRIAEEISQSNWPDFVIFWDKDVVLARALEAIGLCVYNCAHAIAYCDDKQKTMELLSRAKLPVVKTMWVPMTFPSIGYPTTDFLAKVEETFPYPFVLKECYGSFGDQVYLIQNRKEAEEYITRLGGRPLIIQEYVSLSSGRDIRIQMVGDEPVASMLRYNLSDFRANITNGGSMEPYIPCKEEVMIAQKACRTLGLDFAGVDLLFGREGPLVCEVNSNAHFKNIATCTGVNTAEKILDHILMKEVEK